MRDDDQADGHVPVDGKCNGQNHQTDRLCRNPAGWGTKHVGIGYCRKHGGNTPTHVAAAVEIQARRDVERFKARKDIHPAASLLECVQWQAGVVDYWRGRVQELNEDALTWGITREKDGGEDRGTTQEAKPNIVYVLWREATRDLADYCKAALAAGVSERLVQVAEMQGTQFLAVVIRTFTRLGVDISPGSEAARVLLEEMKPLRLQANPAELEEGEA